MKLAGVLICIILLGQQRITNSEFSDGDAFTWLDAVQRLDLAAWLDGAADVALALGVQDFWGQLNEEADMNEEPEVNGLSCRQCISAIGSMKVLVRNGATFEDFLNISMTVCVQLAEGQGYNGEYICPGILDNYGPEVIYAVNVTNEFYSADDICTIYRKCGPDSYDQFNYNPANSARIPEKNSQNDTPEKHVLGDNEKVQTKTRGNTIKEHRNYDELIKAVHITDMHVDRLYQEGSAPLCGLPLCCREDLPGDGSAAWWGDYECAVPPHTVEAFLSQLAEYEPDMIFYTGDTPPHAIWLETQWGQIGDQLYMTDVLGRMFPDIPSYTALGNHDTFPVDFYGRNRMELLTEELNEALGEAWAPLSRFGEEQIETFEFGGYFSVLVQPGLRVISYNSLYGVGGNLFLLVPLMNEEHLEQTRFLEEEFEKARENDEKVVLLGHHPNGSRGRLVYYESFMYNLTRDYGDIIILHLDGHSHKDRFQMTVDRDTGEPRNVWISGPTMGTKSHLNPSARIFYLDPETFAPIDYDNVYFNLSAALELPPETPPQMGLLYRASEEYGMEDLSPASWLELVERMRDEDDVYYRYMYNFETRNALPEVCEGACRHNALCKILTVTAADNDACRQNYEP